MQLEPQHKLAGLQLVRRIASPRDRREVLLAITEDGERRLAGLSAPHKAQLKTIGPALLDALQDVLDDV